MATADWPLTILLSPPGYSLVTHIPAGARDIQIVERKKSADVLGMRVGPERGWAASRGLVLFVWGKVYGVGEGRLTLDPSCGRGSGPRSQNLTWLCVYVCWGVWSWGR